MIKKLIVSLVLLIATGGLLLAQSKKSPTAAQRAKGITFVQQAEAAYRQGDYEQASELAAEAKQLLGEPPTDVYGVKSLVLLVFVEAREDILTKANTRRRPIEALFMSTLGETSAIRLFDQYIAIGDAMLSLKKAEGASGCASMFYASASQLPGIDRDPVRRQLGQSKLMAAMRATNARENDDDDKEDDEKEQKKAARPARPPAATLSPKPRIDASQWFLNLITSGIGTRDLGTKNQNPVSWEATYRAVEKQYGPTSPETAMALLTLGSFYQAKGDFAKADNRLQRGAALLGQAHDEMGQPRTMHAYNQLALLAFQMGQFDKAAQYLRQARSTARQIDRYTRSIEANENMKEWLLWTTTTLHSPVAYATCMQKSPPTTLIQALSFDVMLYQNGLLIDDRRQQKARFRQQVSAIGDARLNKLYDAWIVQKQAFANTVGKCRDQTMEDMQEAETDLLVRLNRFSSPDTLGPARTWQQIQAGLKDKQAAVLFTQVPVAMVNGVPYPVAPPGFNAAGIRSDTLYAAMVLRAGYPHPRFVLLGPQQQLRQLIERSKTPAALYATTKRGPQIPDITYGDALFGFVWKPIESLVSGADRVYFSADGLLNQIAFAALPLPNTTSVANGTYLSNRHELYQLFSLNQLADGPRPFRFDKKTSVLLVGDVDYTPVKNRPAQAETDTNVTYLQAAIHRTGLGPFSALPGAKQEVNSLHKLLPRTAPLTGSDASEPRFVAAVGKAYTVLHMATHGLYITPEPAKKRSDGTIPEESLMRSALALAGANNLWQPNNKPRNDQDGLLTAYEVADLDLSQTRMVVLSGCQTALGDLRTAEGAYGLQRAFRIAGVEKLLMSLWPVGDQAARQFMTTFYTNMNNGQELHEAFRNTQLTMQQKTPQPTDWAAFVLIE